MQISLKEAGLQKEEGYPGIPKAALPSLSANTRAWGLGRMHDCRAPSCRAGAFALVAVTERHILSPVPARVCPCPLLQRQAEIADTCILAASATGKNTLRSVPLLPSCGPMHCFLQVGLCWWESPSFVKAESLGEVMLKWEQDHLPPLVSDLFRHNLQFSIQNNF